MNLCGETDPQTVDVSYFATPLPDGLALVCPPRVTAQAIDAPPELSLRNAVQLLQSLGALDDQEELTDLGARLAGISIDPR